MGDRIMIDFKIIGKRIQKARLEAQLTQEQLVENLQVSTNYLSSIETGRKKPNLEMLDKICNNLGISLSVLITGVATKSDTYLRDDIAALLKKCSANQINLIYDFISRISEESF